MPTIVLFEPRGLSLFQVVRGGIQFTWDFGTGPWSIARRDPHPRPYTVPSNTDNEQSNSFCCRLTSQNGYVVQFSFVESNTTPFFQTINATAAILRASVNRAISARMPFCFNLSRNGLNGSCRLPPIAAEMNTSFKRRLQLWFKPRVATGFRRRTTRPAVISYSELIWVTTAKPT